MEASTLSTASIASIFGKYELLSPTCLEIVSECKLNCFINSQTWAPGNSPMTVNVSLGEVCGPFPALCKSSDVFTETVADITASSFVLETGYQNSIVERSGSNIIMSNAGSPLEKCAGAVIEMKCVSGNCLSSASSLHTIIPIFLVILAIGLIILGVRYYRQKKGEQTIYSALPPSSPSPVRHNVDFGL